jgi:hypothetical protein
MQQAKARSSIADKVMCESVSPLLNDYLGYEILCPLARP